MDADIFRLNRVIEGETPLDLLCSQKGNLSIPEGFVDYDTQPREYILNSISVVINIHTRVSDLYNRPYDQVQEQLRLGIESLKERQENELINNDGYGLLKNIVPRVMELVGMAHRHGARILIDGAQAVAHLSVDLQTLDCDFYVFSRHKLFGPTGIGVLYGKREVLNKMRPYQGGGNMIVDVTFDRTVYQAPPRRFEAGTGNIAALDYVATVGMDSIHSYEQQLLDYTRDALRQILGLTLIGTPREQAGILSFVLDGWTTTEVGQALDRRGIAVRAGHHCAQPILRCFGQESSVRMSLAFYNTVREIDFLVATLREIAAGNKV